VPVVHEAHEKKVTEEMRGPIVTEESAAPIITKEVAKPIVEKEVLPSQHVGTLGTGLASGGAVVREERFV